MVKTVIISRVADGLPLAASMDDEEVKCIKNYWLIIIITNREKFYFKSILLIQRINIKRVITFWIIIKNYFN